MQIRPKDIGHVGIVVRDLDATVDFYVGLVGLQLTERFEYPEEAVGHGGTVRAGAFVRCGHVHHRISFFVLREGVPEWGGGAFHHLAFEMASPSELVEKYREFIDAGVDIVNARRGGPGNQPRFYARDPDGNLLEFYWGIDDIGWDGVPRAYDAIEEINLEEFDFEGFERVRDLAAAKAASVASGD